MVQCLGGNYGRLVFRGCFRLAKGKPKETRPLFADHSYGIWRGVPSKTVWPQGKTTPKRFCETLDQNPSQKVHSKPFLSWGAFGFRSGQLTLAKGLCEEAQFT